MAMSAAAMPLNAPRVTHMHSTPDGDDVDMDEEGDSELEEEIDQLDSDTEDEVPVAVISTSSRPRARQKKPAERVPGVVLLPLDRLENILEPDGVGIHMSKEAYFMLAAATEAFIKRLASAGLHRASLERRSMINYRDVASLPVQYREFTFLQETMPQPMSLSEALQRRAAKAQEVIAPSTSASAVPSPSPSSLPNFTPAGTPTPSIAGDLSHLSVSIKGKGRQTNGKTGGSASATPALTTAPRITNNAAHTRGNPADANGKPVARRQSTREPKPRRRPDEDDDAMVVDEPSAGARATNSRARAPRERMMKANVGVESVSGDGRYSSAPAKNGLAHGASAQNGVETTAAGGKHKQGPALQTSAASFQGEYLTQPLDAEGGRWATTPPSHPATSISGQFSGPGVAYGRGGLLDNPGRTIYSQQRPANH